MGDCDGAVGDGAVVGGDGGGWRRRGGRRLMLGASAGGAARARRGGAQGGAARAGRGGVASRKEKPIEMGGLYFQGLGLSIWRPMQNGSSNRASTGVEF